MARLNFRVTEEMRNRIKRAANRNFESQQALVIRAITTEIEKVEEEAKT